MFRKLIDYVDNHSLSIPFGYDYRKVQYIIEIDKDNIEPSSKEYECPVIDRTSDISPCLFADKAKYFIPFPGNEKYRESMFKLIQEFEQKFPRENFGNRILSTLSKVDVRNIKKEDVILFYNSGVAIVMQDNVKEFWASRIRYKCNSNIVGQCCCCLQRKNLTLKIPKKPYNLDVINNNLPVFKSYCIEKKYVFPICIECADKICSGLSFLRKNESNRFYYDCFLAIFWCVGNVDKNLATLINNPAADDVKLLFTSPYNGRDISPSVDSNEFNILMFEPNSKGPASLKLSCSYSLAEVYKNLKNWFSYHGDNQYSLYMIGDYFLKKFKGRLPLINNDKAKVNLFKDFLNFAFFGTPLPKKYLNLVVSRCSRNSDVTQIEEVILKMFVEEDQKAYTFGEFFWEVECLQFQALEKSETRRLLRAASMRPREIFVKLLNRSENYFDLLGRKKPNLKIPIERKISELIVQLRDLPKRFSIYEQSSFYCGFYARRKAYFDFCKKEKNDE